jgi:hypothetical protein
MSCMKRGYHIRAGTRRELHVRHALPRHRASPSSRPAGRGAYIAALALLQVALLVEVAPRAAPALAPVARIATQDGWPAVAQIVGYAIALVGAATVLAFPALALARHVQRGRSRFIGLPRMGIRICVAGALIDAAAQVFELLAHWRPDLLGPAATAIAASTAMGGIALMAAGALTAEVLRRSVAPMRIPIAPWHCRPVRIEVIDPPELATRAG